MVNEFESTCRKHSRYNSDLKNWLMEDKNITYRSDGYENGETKRKKRFVNSNWDEKPTIIKALYVFSCFL